MTHRAPEPEDKEPEDKEPEDKEPRTRSRGIRWTDRASSQGAGAAAGGLVIVQGVGAVQTLVLGRLLGPAEVGLFIAGTVLLSFIAEIPGVDGAGTHRPAPRHRTGRQHGPRRHVLHRCRIRPGGGRGRAAAGDDLP